jgi:hypothetical protein
MVGPFIVLLVVVAAALILLRLGRDETVSGSRAARWLVLGALILMGLNVAFWLFMGVGEMISGDLSGVGHFVPAAILIALMLLAWRRPLEAGVMLVAVGTLSAIYFSTRLTEGLGFDFVTIVMVGMPLLFGVLLLAAKATARLSYGRG